jgi:hypothetical protein
VRRTCPKLTVVLGVVHRGFGAGGVGGDVAVGVVGVGHRPRRWCRAGVGGDRVFGPAQQTVGAVGGGGGRAVGG